MAIGLGRFKQVGQQMATSEKLAKEYAKQQRKAKKRRGWKGILGKIAGTGLGAGLAGLFGIASGGLLMPLMMAAGQFGGKKFAHEATRGMGAKTTGLKGDEYGYGKGEAKTLAEGLREQMATDPFKEQGGFGKDVLQSYLSAGLQGDLSGVGKALKKGGKWEQALGVGEFGLKDASGEALGIFSGKGWEGTKAGIGGLDFFGEPSVKEEIGEEVIEETELFDEWGNPYSMKQGGYIPKYYGGGSVQGGNVAPTISEYFNMQGKSLGGSNKQSLAEMLGRK